MSLPIRWSPNAVEDLSNTLTYVEAHFGVEAALALIEKIETTTALITEFPEMYVRSVQHPDLRRAVMTRQTALIYRIFSDAIEILHVQDTRQDTDF